MGVPDKRKYKIALTSDEDEVQGKKEYLAKKEKMHGYEYSIAMDIPASSVTYLKVKKRGKK